MYYECTKCETMLDIVGVERSTFVRKCPTCEEPTSWEHAFSGEGVSF